MSSSSSSSPSSSSTHPISAFKLSTLVLDEQIAALTNQIFHNDELMTAYLWHYTFITCSIHQAEYNLDQLWYEQQTIHEYVMAFPQFCQAMQLIVQTYWRQACQSNLHPYTHQPLNLNQPCSPRTSQDSIPSSIPSWSLTSNLLSKSIPPPKVAQPGSANHPINIDADDDHDKTRTVKKPYTIPDKQKPRFKPTCEQCDKWGHENLTAIHLFIHSPTAKSVNGWKAPEVMQPPQCITSPMQMSLREQDPLSRRIGLESRKSRSNPDIYSDPHSNPLHTTSLESLKDRGGIVTIFPCCLIHARCICLLLLHYLHGFLQETMYITYMTLWPARPHALSSWFPSGNHVYYLPYCAWYPHDHHVQPMLPTRVSSYLNKLID